MGKARMQERNSQWNLSPFTMLMAHSWFPYRSLPCRCEERLRWYAGMNHEADFWIASGRGMV